MFKVGYFQFAPRFGRVRENLEKILSALAHTPADLIVLPELSFTGYYFRDRKELYDLAENIETSSTLECLKDFCLQKELYIVTGFAEKSGDKIFNSAVLIGPGKIVHTYRKLHLFNTEKGCFDPGNIPLEVVPVKDAKIGIMICFDWIFPEVARILALKEADILCHPSNLVLSYCQRAMRIRSLENSVFTVTANRYGTEKRPHGELTFTGQSQITDPNGSLLTKAGPDKDDWVVVEIDLDQARDKRRTAKNDIFKDRRPEFYGDLLK